MPSEPRFSNFDQKITDSDEFGDQELLERLPEIKLKYEVGSKLGGGAYGTVFRGIDKRTGDVVAIKVFNFPDPNGVLKSASERVGYARPFIPEIFAQNMVAHPNVAMILDVGKLDDFPAVVMPYYEFDASRFRFKDVAQVTAFVSKVASVMNFMFINGIAHLDIKPNNIMVDTSMTGAPEPIIIDFGVSERLKDLTEVEGRGAKIIDYRNLFLSVFVPLLEKVSSSEYVEGLLGQMRSKHGSRTTTDLLFLEDTSPEKIFYELVRLVSGEVKA